MQPAERRDRVDVDHVSSTWAPRSRPAGLDLDDSPERGRPLAHVECTGVMS